MGSPWKVLLYVSVILLSGLKGYHGLKLKLYEKANYDGFQGEFNLKPEEENKCVTLSDKGLTVGSVTTDKCVIFYLRDDCTTPKDLPLPNPFLPVKWPDQWSHRFDQNTAKFGTNLRNQSPYKSFHVCSQALGGGPQLDLDIYDSPWTGNRIVKKYRGVCSCRNIPISVSRNEYMYVDIHGNAVNMFPEEGCRGNSKQVGPHDGYLNRYVYGAIKFAPRSFEPIGLDKCYSLHADIFKFIFKNETDNIDNLVTKKVKLSADSIFHNNAISESTERYLLSSTATETVQFSVAESIKQTHSAGVKVGVEIKATAGVPLVGSAEIKTELEANYQWSQEHGSDRTNTTTMTKEQKIDIEKTIGIPPCSRCVVSTVMKTIEDFPVLYDLYAIVRASGDFKELTASQVRKNLPAGMKYIRDHDEHSVEAATTGTMRVYFGLETITSNNCTPIRGCGPAGYSPPAPSHSEIHIPIPVDGSKLKFGGSPQQTRSTIWSFFRETFGILLMRHQ